MHTINVVSDLPDHVDFKDGLVALDTETTGLSPVNDTLCLVQVSDGHGRAWLIRRDPAHAFDKAIHLRRVLTHGRLTKLFHFARFDMAVLQQNLGLENWGPFYCTKIASRLVRPADEKHNLRALVHESCGVLLDKGEQLSNWAAETLTDSQVTYAANDVLYLHAVHGYLERLMRSQKREPWLSAALHFLPTRVAMDLAETLTDADVFSHH